MLRCQHPGGLSQAEIGERAGMARSTAPDPQRARRRAGGPRGARGSVGPEITRMATTVRLGVVTGDDPFLTELSRELDDGGLCRSRRGSGGPGRAAPQRRRAGRERSGEPLCTAAPTARPCWPRCRLSGARAAQSTGAADGEHHHRPRRCGISPSASADGTPTTAEEQTEGLRVGAVLRGCRLELVAQSRCPRSGSTVRSRTPALLAWARCRRVVQRL